MEEIIQIKCPFDGTVLYVKNQAGIENKNVTRPICKHKYPFTRFKRVGQSSCGDKAVLYNDESGYATELPKMNYSIGKLTLIGSDVSYQLKFGRNVIGRKSNNSEADFQIDTAEKHSMSREHIVIEVKKNPKKGFVHCLSLYKENVNPTFVRKDPLLYGDNIILNHGDLIDLPDATLRLDFPDDDATEI